MAEEELLNWSDTESSTNKRKNEDQLTTPPSRRRTAEVSDPIASQSPDSANAPSSYDSVHKFLLVEKDQPMPARISNDAEADLYNALHILSLDTPTAEELPYSSSSGIDSSTNQKKSDDDQLMTPPPSAGTQQAAGLYAPFASQWPISYNSAPPLANALQIAKARVSALVEKLRAQTENSAQQGQAFMFTGQNYLAKKPLISNVTRSSKPDQTRYQRRHYKPQNERVQDLHANMVARMASSSSSGLGHLLMHTPTFCKADLEAEPRKLEAQRGLLEAVRRKLENELRLRETAEKNLAEATQTIKDLKNEMANMEQRLQSQIRSLADEMKKQLCSQNNCQPPN